MIVKAFPYRATALEEFSSDYTFSPVNIPVNDTQWITFANFLRTTEQPIYTPITQWQRVYGYNTNDPKAAHVFARDWVTLADIQHGTFVPGAGDVKGAGDQAACVSWLSSVKTAKGKPLFFRKFHHEPWMPSGGGDNLAADYLAALNVYASVIRTYLGGPYSTKYPAGVPSDYKVIPYVMTRTLKRRGKRPVPPA